MNARRANRPLCFAALCLFLGAAATVGVALAVLLGPGAKHWILTVGDAYSHPWPPWTDKSLPAPIQVDIMESSTCRAETVMTRTLQATGYDFATEAADLRSGWPWKALWCGRLQTQNRTGPPPWPTSFQRRGISIHKDEYFSRVPWQFPYPGTMATNGGEGPGVSYIPLTPAWPGFMGDTALYSGAWALLILATAPLRRLRARLCARGDRAAALRPRRTWAARGLIGAAVLVAVFYAISPFGSWYLLSSSGVYTSIGSGVVRLGYSPQMAQWLGTGWTWADEPGVNWWFAVERGAPPNWALRVPLWAVAGVLAAGGWWVRRQARADITGRCPNCGYDLKGLAGGPCPECGTSAKKMAR